MGILHLFAMIVRICILLLCASIIKNIDGLNKISKNIELNDILVDFNNAFTNGTNNFVEITQRSRAADNSREEDKYLNTTELIRKYGFTAQEYSVNTEDGYVLTLIRICGCGPSVFLMHGLLGSSDDFLVSGPDRALAYMLANAGYDVWLGNARGNKYSKQHERLSTEGKEYWDFSWHEIGLYDLPAMIDYALESHWQAQLTYIGHGQGTTVFFAMCSYRPEYNKKIRLFVSLGTIAYVWHVRSPVIRALVPYRQRAYQVSQALGLYELLPSSPLTQFLTSVVCSSSKVALLACSTILFNLFGYDYSQIDYENLPVQLSHFPAGSSYKQLDHYLQLAESKRFALYDHGEQMNLLKYNATVPPDYPVENVVVPVVIFYGDNDWLSSFDDAQILVDRLRNVQVVYRVPHVRFNHFDYIWGKDAGQLVYYKLMDIIDKDYNAGVGMFQEVVEYDNTINENTSV